MSLKNIFPSLGSHSEMSLPRRYIFVLEIVQYGKGERNTATTSQ
jgi:hypothetical protein